MIMRKEFLPFAKPLVSEEAIADVADSIRKVGWQWVLRQLILKINLPIM